MLSTQIVNQILHEQKLKENITDSGDLRGGYNKQGAATYSSMQYGASRSDLG